MPAATNKQRLLNNLFPALSKKYHPPAPPDRPVLEQLIYAIIREGASREAADLAFRNLREKFFDWNEVRVSSVHELAEAIDGIPQAGARAQKLIELLQEIFESTYSFDLEPLHKKGLKQAEKQISRYQATDDFAVAWVAQRSLGGHAIPVDAPTLRCTRRLGLVEEGESKSARGSLEHAIPKAKGVLFTDLISALANDLCIDPVPLCGSCPLRPDCPTGQAFVAAGRAKPKSR